MSSGDMRARRSTRKSVDYNDAAYDDRLRDALQAHGDDSPLDNGVPADPGDEDATFRPLRVEDDDDDEYDSDHYEEDEDGNHVVRKRREKTKAEVAAEMQVAEGLGVSYPKGYKELRKGLGYAYRAVCRDSRVAGIRYALDRLVLDDRLTAPDRDTIVTTCQAVADRVVVPRSALAKVFAPFSGHNGGVFTKTGMAGTMPTLTSIALAVDMCGKIAEYRANGSAQAQGFADLLGNAGLGGDVVAVLTQQHATETPEQSARVAGEKLAEQLNALDDGALVQVLFYNLANFEQRAANLQPDGYSLPREYDYSKFDATKPKGALKIAENNGTVDVSVSLLHRTVSTDSYTTKLGAAYDTFALPGHADYKECNSFPDSEFAETPTQTDEMKAAAREEVNENPSLAKARQDRDAAERLARGLGYGSPEYRAYVLARDREYTLYSDLMRQAKRRIYSSYEGAYNFEKEDLGPYVVTHRAQTTVYAAVGPTAASPVPSTVARQCLIAKAMKSMLLSTTEATKATAPKLKAYLEKSVARKPKTDAGLDPCYSNYWGAGHDAYVAVRYAGVPIKLGRQNKRDRTIHDRNQGHLASGVLKQHKRHQLQKWLKLDRHLPLESFVEIMCPPWKMTGTGLVEFFVLITDTPPEDVISVKVPRKRSWDDGLFLANDDALRSQDFKDEKDALLEKFYADMHKGENPDRRKKKRLKADEKEQLSALESRFAREAEKEYRAANLCHPEFKMGYPPGLGANESAQKRASDKVKALAHRDAMAHYATVVAADPDLGGADIQNTTGFGVEDAFTAAGPSVA